MNQQPRPADGTECEITIRENALVGEGSDVRRRGVILATTVERHDTWAHVAVIGYNYLHVRRLSEIELIPEESIECAACEGKGWAQRGVTCATCGGSGLSRAYLVSRGEAIDFPPHLHDDGRKVDPNLVAALVSDLRTAKDRDTMIRNLRNTIRTRSTWGALDEAIAQLAEAEAKASPVM